MTPERLQQIRAVFESVVDFPPDDRNRILAETRDADPSLVVEVELLVAAYERRGDFMSQPIADLHSPAASSETDLAGSRIGSYEIVQEIGRGGMGTVYEAARIDGSFRKRVAIKVIRATLLTESMHERFRRERQILAGLDHPNIAGILDGGATETGRPYFVMEYVSGVRIDRYCLEHHLDIDGRLDLFSRVCDAVQYAHDHMIVHCDLKPGNILVTPEGSVKLLDFGIAKILADPAQTQPPSLAASALILTPEYASPEQVLGKSITAATDVYLLGVLLYELLTGLNPMHGSGDLPHQVMSAVCERIPLKPSIAVTEDVSGGFHGWRRQLKGELDNIGMRALQKDPVRRYSSVALFRDDLDRYKNGLPVMAQGDRFGYRAEKFLRRNMAPIAAVTLVILSLTAGIVVSVGEAKRARQEQYVANQQRSIADVQRRFAQAQEAAAERARRQTVVQEARAEQKADEAGQQRTRADLERARAEKRLGELRSLVTTLLFELHDGIRDLAGSAGARRLVLAKAQQYLEILSGESGGDLQLQRELASAYEKTGDLLHDAIGPGSADGGSLANYQKAFELRRAISRQQKTDRPAQRDLAFSLSKVGDGQFFNGQTGQALVDYQRSLTMQEQVLRQEPSDPESRKVAGYIQNRRCIVLAAAGDAVHATEACRASIGYLDSVVTALSRDRLVRRTLAATCAAFGNLLRHLNQVPEALSYLAKASALFEALAGEQPNNVEYRRLMAYTQIYVAQALLAQDDRVGAMTTYSQAVASMHTLMSIDPTDSKAPAGLALALTRMAAEMKKIGDLENAEKAGSEAIELMRAVAERPGAGAYEWNDYANALLKAEIESLRQPAKALELALRANTSTKEANALFLDTLAWAYFRTGDAPSAIRTERQALSLVPAGNALGQGLRSELEQGLAEFEIIPKK
jgi:tetratricopeptide (TPR) repeat protein/tRNA A-37 threonylcarbamoyl transferase component Bud32